MAAPATGEFIIGAFAFFVESGKTVDGDIVSATYRPDNVPTTNFTELGCIEDGGFEQETQADPKRCLQLAGGFLADPREVVVNQFLRLTTNERNEWIERLQFRLAAEAALDVAATPFAQASPGILGWLKIQGRASSTTAALSGNDRFLLDLWVKMTLESGGTGFNSSFHKPVLRFQLQDSTLNSIWFPTPS